MHVHAGRNVATLEAVQGLLQREANGASEQSAVCMCKEDGESLSGQPLAHEALSILQQSLIRRGAHSNSSECSHSSRDLTGRLQAR